ncbi:MAG TPA: hypothetical protein VHG33_13050, partial [Woeseiaceae bacterium]|nr:hypothetical protein [Woeseiaceae bacterium]
LAGHSRVSGTVSPPPMPASGALAELFKIRDGHDVVVGVASRLAGGGAAGSVVEWTLHLPARGSLYATMEPDADEGQRSGSLRAGTREFAGLRGSVVEKHFAVREVASTGIEIDGRIELVTALIGAGEPAG